MVACCAAGTTELAGGIGSGARRVKGIGAGMAFPGGSSSCATGIASSACSTGGMIWSESLLTMSSSESMLVSISAEGLND